MSGQPALDGIRAALCAALPGWVKEVFNEQPEIWSKGSDGLDLVTNVDLNMQRLLKARLQELLPGSSVVGEEDYRPHEGSGPLWLVDPLDGTVNFVAGLPVYSVAVVLMIDGEPTLSAVYDIVQNDLYSAQKGGGARLNEEPLLPEPRQSNLAIVSSGLLKDFAIVAPDALAQLLTMFKLRNFGSQALHLCYAAAGRVSLVASREAKGWDDMAGALIAQEAGLRYASYDLGDAPVRLDNDQKSLCAPREIFEKQKPLFARSCA
ncbi:inositol monophosphatase family protein [Ruegeria lacuscaerulensis]|uniref:inositol monophosphatase family protein n=1 Tax=Ruegeria lacuscaerulensis TaxID=55218 RepID=UPI00147DD675|nr:inositol monophosphatase family protein [Ruegeria lacuscaerulensis]